MRCEHSVTVIQKAVQPDLIVFMKDESLAETEDRRNLQLQSSDHTPAH